jgi:riboflavin kinase / FMN adenylyltransferase
MQITEDFIDYFRKARAVVTLGNFDGIHKGHQKIFAAVVRKAREIRGAPVVITFDPHPVKVLMPERRLRLITTVQDKEQIIFRSGIRDIINIDFNAEFAHMDADDFIRDILVGLLKVKWVIVGHNYTFGRAKKGNAEILRNLGRKSGFGVSVVRYAKLNGDLISSSRIRSAVLAGRVAEVSRMLGRAYHIEGSVVRGTGRGLSLLKTPTANIQTENELIPKEGVYAVKISMGGNVYDGVANLGENPTFKFGILSYEIHIFDFRRNLLGKKMRVHFMERLRDEKKFASIDDLSAQIKKDIERAKRLLSGKKTELNL